MDTDSNASTIISDPDSVSASASISRYDEVYSVYKGLIPNTLNIGDAWYVDC